MSRTLNVCATILCLSLLTILCGCGGGGGGGTVTITPAATTRQLVSGLNYSYKFTGTIQDASGTTPITGNMTIGLAAGTFNGQPTHNGLPVLLENRATVLNVSGTPVAGNTVVYLTQAANRDILRIGEDDEGTQIGFNPVVIDGPGTITATTALSQTSTKTNGDAFSAFFTVQKAERISVQAGTFDCWKVSTSETDGPDVTVQTVWYDARLGYPVKLTGTSTNSEDVTTISGTFELTSTNALTP